jgi:hypothetical protein
MRWLQSLGAALSAPFNSSQRAEQSARMLAARLRQEHELRIERIERDHAITTKLGRTCRTCKHWSGKITSGNNGICRRFPPHNMQQPRTRPDQRCGEWLMRVVNSSQYAHVMEMKDGG